MDAKEVIFALNKRNQDLSLGPSSWAKVSLLVAVAQAAKRHGHALMWDAMAHYWQNPDRGHEAVQQVQTAPEQFAGAYRRMKEARTALGDSHHPWVMGQIFNLVNN